MAGVVAPQLTVGTVAGTSLAVRWFGADITDDLGRLTLLGVGAQHDLGRYFTDLPVDLSVAGAWQSIELGHVVETTAAIGSVLVGKRYGVLGLFGGVGYESSSTEITIDSENGGSPNVISLDAGNSVRVTGGFALHLKVVELFGDFTLASQKAFTLGVGFGR
jgi:hypothetical protein